MKRAWQMKRTIEDVVETLKSAKKRGKNAQF
jgi:hypothetical protein